MFHTGNGTVLPVNRTSVGTVHFGMTGPNLELLQPVMCPYAGNVLPVAAKLYYDSLSLPTHRFLGEISAIHKEERTVENCKGSDKPGDTETPADCYLWVFLQCLWMFLRHKKAGSTTPTVIEPAKDRDDIGQQHPVVTNETADMIVQYLFS